MCRTTGLHPHHHDDNAIQAEGKSGCKGDCPNCRNRAAKLAAAAQSQNQALPTTLHHHHANVVGASKE